MQFGIGQQQVEERTLAGRRPQSEVGQQVRERIRLSGIGIKEALADVEQQLTSGEMIVEMIEDGQCVEGEGRGVGIGERGRADEDRGVG